MSQRITHTSEDYGGTNHSMEMKELGALNLESAAQRLNQVMPISLQPARMQTGNMYWIGELIITNMKITDGGSTTENIENMKVQVFILLSFTQYIYYKSTLILSRMSFWLRYFLPILLYWEWEAYSNVRFLTKWGPVSLSLVSMLCGGFR